MCLGRVLSSSCCCSCMQLHTLWVLSPHELLGLVLTREQHQLLALQVGKPLTTCCPQCAVQGLQIALCLANSHCVICPYIHV